MKIERRREERNMAPEARYPDLDHIETTRQCL